jgi:hypothetical protein
MIDPPAEIRPLPFDQDHKPMKLIYRPFGLIIGILAGLASKKLFEALWGVFDEEEPPKPVTRQAAWPKILAAAAFQGVVFKLVRAGVDRAGAKGFNYLTGTWPGPEKTEKSQAAEAVR